MARSKTAYLTCRISRPAHPQNVTQASSAGEEDERLVQGAHGEANVAEGEVCSLERDLSDCVSDGSLKKSDPRSVEPILAESGLGILGGVLGGVLGDESEVPWLDG